MAFHEINKLKLRNAVAKSLISLNVYRCEVLGVEL
jgi:hypothetical protein